MRFVLLCKVGPNVILLSGSRNCLIINSSQHACYLKHGVFGHTILESKMNFKVALIALGLAGALVGTVQAADNTISKKITLTAQINDALFVSKADGSTWYGTEALDATDYTQQKFAKTLPVRVWSTHDEFNVSLAQPLKMSNGTYEMTNAVVGFDEQSIIYGAPLAVTQTVAGVGGYDQVHNLNISVDAPVKSGSAATNGSYSGDLIMMFEPVASVEE